ncbi:MAG TPA: hypothetical protein VMV81_13055 [Phycisphaerae bacterium]|nr:hypothetical protein [Phycisphaerae bacterium]
MAQPPYRSSEGHPMRRFALFSTALLVLVIIGSVPWKAGGLNKSVNKSMCVCLPSRAALMIKSITNVSAVTVKPAVAKR